MKFMCTTCNGPPFMAANTVAPSSPSQNITSLLQYVTNLTDTAVFQVLQHSSKSEYITLTNQLSGLHTACAEPDHQL